VGIYKWRPNWVIRIVLVGISPTLAKIPNRKEEKTKVAKQGYKKNSRKR